MVAFPIINRFRGARLRCRQRRIAEARNHFPELDPVILDGFFTNFGYTMALSLLVKIDVICKTIKPSLVVEFGSGLSTVVIANALSCQDGFLITFDESMKWLAKTCGLLNPHTLGVAFVCVPHSDEMNHAALSRYILCHSKPELVVIDGPSKGARFSPSTLEVYCELLSSNCVCVIDDTDRDENDLGASKLAANFSLRKCDYGDPIYVNHQYSILLPEDFDDKILLP